MDTNGRSRFTGRVAQPGADVQELPSFLAGQDERVFRCRFEGERHCAKLAGDVLCQTRAWTSFCLVQKMLLHRQLRFSMISCPPSSPPPPRSLGLRDPGLRGARRRLPSLPEPAAHPRPPSKKQKSPCLCDAFTQTRLMPTFWVSVGRLKVQRWRDGHYNGKAF